MLFGAPPAAEQREGEGFRVWSKWPKIRILAFYTGEREIFRLLDQEEWMDEI